MRGLFRSHGSNHRRAFDFAALVLALAALAVQAIAPICLYGFSASHAPGGVPIVLCTAHGFQTVTLDANGKPVPPAPDQGSSDGLCPMCVAFHAVPLLAMPAALLLAVLLSWRKADRATDFAPVLLRRAYASFVTRGPPAVACAAPI